MKKAIYSPNQITMQKLICLGIAALFLLGCDRKVEIPKDIGLQFYSLRNQFDKDIPGTLDMIQSWGIQTIEGGDTYGMERADFQEMLNDRGLKVVSVGANYDELHESLEEVIEETKSYGAKYVMIPWIPHDGDNFSFEDTKKAVMLFNQAGKKISEAGLQLIYHPHGYEFRPHEDGNLMDYMLNNAEHFNFEMDVFWFTHGGADPLEYLNAHPEKFKLMHLKDMRKGVKGNDSGHEDVETNVVLGTGQIDMAALVKRARELNVEYMFIEDESSQVVDQVPNSLKFLVSLQ